MAISFPEPIPGRLEVLRLLLNHGAPTDIRRFEDTPYHFAKLGKRSRHGLGTPVHAAVSRNRPDALELLLSRGASRDVESTTGETALKYAKEHGMHTMVEMLESTAVPDEGSQ
jgi:ankyrin repeat protein